MPTEPTRLAFADLPETGAIRALLSDLSITRQAATAPCRVAPLRSMTLRDFLASANWRNMRLPPLTRASASPSALTLRTFLAAVNWRNVAHDEADAAVPSELATEQILAEFVWD